mgnify:CR=1 FL=1|jgi:hypothetical protein
MPRLWLANAEEVLPEADPFYDEFVRTRTMRMFPRFLLALDPGDLLVAPLPIPRDYTEYVARLLGLGDPGRLALEVRGRTAPYSLVEALLADPEALAEVRERTVQGGWVLEPFVESPRVLRLGEETGIPAGRSAVELVRSGRIGELNDKAWFKAFAASLGLPTVSGEVAFSREQLQEAILRMSPLHPDLMLRKGIFAGGAGNTHGSALELLGRVPTWYAGGSVLVEPFLDISSVAGSLAWLGPTTVRFMGIDLQVIRDGSWSGFDYPHPAGIGADRIREGTVSLAEELHQQGARGYLNLDWAILRDSPEAPLLLECNFRHNGFGYVTELAEKYFGPTWESLVIASREGLPTRSRSAAELLKRLSDLRLEGHPVLLSAPGGARGAVLTSPPEAGAFSVAVFAEDACWVERALERVEEAA